MYIHVNQLWLPETVVHVHACVDMIQTYGQKHLFLLLIVLEQVYSYRYIHNFGMTTTKINSCRILYTSHTLQFTS